MALHHLHSYQPLSCKVGITYSQVLWYNMIVSKDHIFQEKLNKILQGRVYPQQLIIKNINKPSSKPAVACYVNEHLSLPIK